MHVMDFCNLLIIGSYPVSLSPHKQTPFKLAKKEQATGLNLIHYLRFMFCHLETEGGEIFGMVFEDCHGIGQGGDGVVIGKVHLAHSFF